MPKEFSVPEDPLHAHLRALDRFHNCLAYGDTSSELQDLHKYAEAVHQAERSAGANQARCLAA